MANFLERRKQKKHYADKVAMTQKKIWDLQFYKRQLENEKESFRVEYDRIKESVDAAQLRLTGELEKPADQQDATIKNNLEALIAKYNPEMENLKAAMSGIDVQIEGLDVDDPDQPGKKIHKQGVQEMVEQHRSLMELLKEYRDQV